MARLLLLLVLLVTTYILNSEEKDDDCELTIMRGPKGNTWIQNRPCYNNSVTCGQVQPGKYMCKNECEMYRHTAIGIGLLAGLMFILLVVAIIGWVITCCLMYRTTEFSIKPKTIKNQYIDSETPTLHSTSTTSFQPSTKYSLFGPSYETPSNKEGDHISDEQEGIYEVLDGDETKLIAKRVTGTERQVLLSGEQQSGLYDQLKFEDLS